MKVHRFKRSHDKWDCDDKNTVELLNGDLVILTSRRGSRAFIYTIDTSGTPYCCYGKCGICRNTCMHYGFTCSYYGYLKPIDYMLENI